MAALRTKLCRSN